MPEFKAGARKREPTHPGQIIESSLHALHMSARQAAIAMGITPMALLNVMKQSSGVTPAMALRLGKFFGNGPQLWMGLQVDHDLWHAKAAMKEQLAKIREARQREDA